MIKVQLLLLGLLFVGKGAAEMPRNPASIFSQVSKNWLNKHEIIDFNRYSDQFDDIHSLSQLLANQKKS